MINYDKNIDELVSNTFVVNNGRDCRFNVFRYIGLPVERLFEEHYQFFQQYLDEYLRDYNISPTKLFYNDCDSINGWAAKKNGVGIISINRGSLVKLKTLFSQEPDFFASIPDLKRIHEIESKCDSPIWRLMHQTCFLYLFYHEVGHIIQNSSHTNFDVIDEITDIDSSYSKLSHELEIDADTFAAIRLGKHALRYWRKLSQGGGKNLSDLETIVSIIVSGIGVYRLKLFHYSGPFYYKKLAHPHIVVRIGALITNILDYINHELRETNELEGTEIDPKNGYEVSLVVFKHVADMILGTETTSDFRDIFIQESTGIRDYYGELIAGMKSNPESAYNKTLVLPKRAEVKTVDYAEETGKSTVIKEHDIVELTVDLLQIPLLLGSKGTVVHIYPHAKAFEVEFIKKDGSSTVETVEPHQISKSK